MSRLPNSSQAEGQARVMGRGASLLLNALSASESRGGASSSTCRHAPFDLAASMRSAGDRLSWAKWDGCHMQRAFRSSGGILDGNSFSQLLREVTDQPISRLARWIVNREVVSFECRGQVWLPTFQFTPVDLMVRPVVGHVIAELREPLDDAELAQWFVTPNCWLRGWLPAELTAHDPEAVIDAARADRFVALG